MKNKKPSGPDCSGCSQLGIVIGDEGCRFWCFEYSVELISEDEKCAECLRDMPEE